MPNLTAAELARHCGPRGIVAWTHALGRLKFGFRPRETPDADAAPLSLARCPEVTR